VAKNLAFLTDIKTQERWRKESSILPVKPCRSAINENEKKTVNATHGQLTSALKMCNYNKS